MAPFLSQTAQRILRTLFDHPVQEFKEIELITEAGTGKGSAGILINTFIEDGLLQERRAGKTKLISLHLAHPVVFFLKNLFDQEKIKRLSKQQLAAVLLFKREAEPAMSLLVLFGSTLAGTATRESDIDLLIVSRDLQVVENARKKAEELLGQRLNLHIYDDAVPKIQADIFLQNALLQGATMYGFDVARTLYSLLGRPEKKSLERTFFFKDRINAAWRNYRNNDKATAGEIIEKLQEQLIFYLLSDQRISYESKKDAAKKMEKLPEGKIFNRIKKSRLKEKIEILSILVQTILIDTVLEGEGYERNKR